MAELSERLAFEEIELARQLGCFEEPVAGIVVGKFGECRSSRLVMLPTNALNPLRCGGLTAMA